MFPRRVDRPPISFELGDFDAEIEGNGTRVIWEQGVRCPCRSVSGTGQSDPTCEVCDSAGYFYHSPAEIKVVFNRPEAESNWTDQWGDWSNGDGQVTPRSEVLLGPRDRLTMLDSVFRLDEIVKMPGQGKPLCTRFPIVTRDVTFQRGTGADCEFVDFSFRVLFLGYKDGSGRIRTLREGADFAVNSEGRIDFINRPVEPGTPLSVSYYARPRWIVVSLIPFPFQDTFQTERVETPVVLHLPRTVKISLDYFTQAGQPQLTEARELA
jgi:hypothetical protein